MRTIRLWLAAILIASVSVPVFAGGQGQTGGGDRFELLGAGASFPAPLITAWADEYRTVTNGRVTVNYQSIGSGGGIRQFIEQTIMFGATEAALNDTQMNDAKTKTGGLAYNMPVTLGDVVLTYNVPGVNKGLVFNAEIIANLFLGKITRWNDSGIAALNPGASLPDLAISIAHRSDGSGTTSVFTDYLSKVSPEWAEKVGRGSSVNWPVGTGGNGNEGVAGIVMSTPGALGYNSLVYAVLNDISYANVINSSGNTIVPSLEATSLSAAVQIPQDGRVSLTNTAAARGYPITGLAWVLVYENLEKNAAIKSEAEASEVVKFLYWAVTEGQKFNERLSFARLPKDAQDIAIKMLETLKYEGRPVGKNVIASVKANGF